MHWRLLRCGSSLRVIADPLQRDPGEPREAEDPATGGREIDHPTARIWAPIGDRNDNTAPISVIGNAHLAPEGQRLVRGGQCTIVQMATARRVCAQLACRIERCNAAFGTRARLTLAASSRQPPPANAMNSRRLTSSMGGSPRCVVNAADWPVLSLRHLPTCRRAASKVFGADLKCSESRWGAADPLLCCHLR